MNIENFSISTYDPIYPIHIMDLDGVAFRIPYDWENPFWHPSTTVLYTETIEEFKQIDHERWVASQ